MLSFALSPKEWMQKRLVRITNDRINELLGLDKSEKFASLVMFLARTASINLVKFVEAANEKSASKRDKI